MHDNRDRSSPAPSRVRRERTNFPEVVTFTTTRTQLARLNHARETRSINKTRFLRAALEAALNALEGMTATAAPHEPRQVAVRKFAAR